MSPNMKGNIMQAQITTTQNHVRFLLIGEKNKKQVQDLGYCTH